MAERRRRAQAEPQQFRRLEAPLKWQSEPRVAVLHADEVYIQQHDDQCVITFGAWDMPYGDVTQEFREQVTREGVPVIPVAKVVIKVEKVQQMATALGELLRQAQDRPGRGIEIRNSPIDNASQRWFFPLVGHTATTRAFISTGIRRADQAQIDLLASFDSGASVFPYVDRVAVLEETIAELQTAVNALRRQNSQLRRRVTALEEEVEILKVEEEVIELRDIPREQAKEEIKALFQTGGIHYMSEIAEQLRLEDSLVVEICQELLREEEIEKSDNLLR